MSPNYLVAKYLVAKLFGWLTVLSSNYFDNKPAPLLKKFLSWAVKFYGNFRPRRQIFCSACCRGRQQKSGRMTAERQRRHKKRPLWSKIHKRRSVDDDDDDVNNDVGFVCNAEDAKNVVWKELKFCRHRHKREAAKKARAHFFWCTFYSWDSEALNPSVTSSAHFNHNWNLSSWKVISAQLFYEKLPLGSTWQARLMCSWALGDGLSMFCWEVHLPCGTLKANCI